MSTATTRHISKAPRPHPLRHGRDARVTVALLALLLVSCAAKQPTTAPVAPAAPPPKPLLIHCPGVGGLMAIDRYLIAGLRLAMPDWEFVVYDWTEKQPGMPALTDKARHERQSQKIADMITARRREAPAGRITLSGHSAGAGMAVFALEKLPDDVQVDTLLMMQSALSPTYDLSKALCHTKGRAFAFYSNLDAFVLGFGTRTFGTVDGEKVEAAGKVGFVVPAGGDAVQYQKLKQFAYDSSWLRFGNIGDHIGPMNRWFARDMLAPLLLTGALPAVEPLSTRSSTQPSSRPTTLPTTLPQAAGEKTRTE